MRQNVTKIAVVAIVIFVMSGAVLHGKQFKLWGSQTRQSFSGTKRGGNTVNLASNARIVRVSRNADGYVVFRNGALYVSVEKGQKLSGILPPGEYTLQTSLGSVALYLDTKFTAENITLWGRQNAVVSPRFEGNCVSLGTPTKIVGAHYDGTDGMGIFRNGGRPAFMQYISPHNLQDPGPKVIDASGAYLGKTLFGQILPVGAYELVPGRGTGVGRVYGDVLLNVGGAAGALVALPVFSQVAKQGSANFKSNRYNAVRVATRSFDQIPYHMTRQYEGTLRVQENQQVRLAGDSEGTKSWYVDNFLLFEITGPKETKRFIIGTVDPVTYEGKTVPQLQPRGFTFGPDKFDLADQFPKGVPVNVKISALDYGGVGGLSDLYLIIR